MSPIPQKEEEELTGKHPGSFSSVSFEIKRLSDPNAKRIIKQEIENDGI